MALKLTKTWQGYSVRLSWAEIAGCDCSTPDESEKLYAVRNFVRDAIGDEELYDFIAALLVHPAYQKLLAEFPEFAEQAYARVEYLYDALYDDVVVGFTYITPKWEGD